MLISCYILGINDLKIEIISTKLIYHDIKNNKYYVTISGLLDLSEKIKRKLIKRNISKKDVNIIQVKLDYNYYLIFDFSNYYKEIRLKYILYNNKKMNICNCYTKMDFVLHPLLFNKKILNKYMSCNRHQRFNTLKNIKFKTIFINK